ncbi:MAG: WD40/YVTN/BNR-like repeat-containing protein [Actinomycetota bacterium]
MRRIVTAVLLAGTGSGIHLVDQNRGVDLHGRVTAIAAGTQIWAVAEDHAVLTSDDGIGWRRIAGISDLSVRCLLLDGDGALAGTSEAHLYRIGAGTAKRVESFEQVEGRDAWHTPWGGTPDTRSLARGPDGSIYANVHVGGIPTSDDQGATWRPTIEIDADVHQVTTEGELVLAACAPGLAISEDHGVTWRMDSDGLHGRYCRAVAVAGDVVLVSASTGPFSKQAAVYRRALGSDGAFTRCAGGLPDWFGSNIDSHCLSASGDTIAIGTDDGEVWLSRDRGEGWELAAKGLTAVSCLAFADLQ